MTAPQDDPLAYLDAVFLSPHKFVGGPGTPGVLIARRSLFRNPVPAWPGGGTVRFVTAHVHRYLEDPEAREEAGTPEIVGAIRAGLVFELKRAVGTATIEQRERAFVRRALERWRRNPSMEILGNPEVDRLAIVSFRVRCGERLLHHDFIASVLNDLLGIQSRAGCSCAGPYGVRLLRIPDADVEALMALVLAGWEGIKPGWTRVNLNYFLSEEEVAFLIEAVDLVAREAWRLLPLYTFDPRTGQWRHRDAPEEREEGLGGFLSAAPEASSRRTSRLRLGPEALRHHLDQAREILRGEDGRYRERLHGWELPPEFEAMRWFWLPHEEPRMAEAGHS